jgi:hypothetical protein
MLATGVTGEDNGRVAYILPDPAQTTSSGWECPRCRRVWSPSVLACHHCPAPAELPAADFALGHLAVPAEMTRRGSYRHARISKEWTEVMPDLQCRYGGTDAGPDFALVQFRLKPAEDSP